jgi:hypothetical protein
MAYILGFLIDVVAFSVVVFALAFVLYQWYQLSKNLEEWAAYAYNWVRCWLVARGLIR